MTSTGNEPVGHLHRMGAVDRHQEPVIAPRQARPDNCGRGRTHQQDRREKLDSEPVLPNRFVGNTAIGQGLGHMTLLVQPSWRLVS